MRPTLTPLCRGAIRGAGLGFPIFLSSFSGQKVACETASGYVGMRQRVAFGKQVGEGGPVDG